MELREGGITDLQEESLVREEGTGGDLHKDGEGLIAEADLKDRGAEVANAEVGLDPDTADLVEGI